MTGTEKNVLSSFLGRFKTIFLLDVDNFRKNPGTPFSSYRAAMNLFPDFLRTGKPDQPGRSVPAWTIGGSDRFLLKELYGSLLDGIAVSGCWPAAEGGQDGTRAG